MVVNYVNPAHAPFMDVEDLEPVAKPVADSPDARHERQPPPLSRRLFSQKAPAHANYTPQSGPGSDFKGASRSFHFRNPQPVENPVVWFDCVQNYRRCKPHDCHNGSETESSQPAPSRNSRQESPPASPRILVVQVCPSSLLLEVSLGRLFPISSASEEDQIRGALGEIGHEHNGCGFRSPRHGPPFQPRP